MKGSRDYLMDFELEDFAEWATEHGWKRTRTVGEFEVLRLVRTDRRPGDQPAIFHRRERGHKVTAHGIGEALARTFHFGVTVPRSIGLIDRDRRRA